jgi:hypothetical protein
MSKSDDPRRLEYDASPELKRVLDALRADGPGGARMQRMAQKLEPWLDSPPAVRGAGGTWFNGPFGKIGLIVLASGALLALLPRMFRDRDEPRSTAAETARDVSAAGPATAKAAAVATTQALATQPAQPSMRPAAKVEIAVTQRTASQPVQPKPKPEAVRTAATLAAVRAPIARRAARARSSDVSTAPSTAPLGSNNVSGEGSGADATPAPDEASAPISTAHAKAVAEDAEASDSRAAAPVNTVATREALVSPKQTPASQAPVADEASLLQQARRLAHERPAQALQLLGQHAQRFAHGMLAPEREVLAIEILRAEGRNTEADARLRAFRRSYPDSVYLERLEHPKPRS